MRTRFNCFNLSFCASAASFVIGSYLATGAGQARGSETNSVSLWDGSTESLFRKAVNEAAITFGPGLGMPVLGSELHHNWVIGMAQYGWMLTDVVAERHWYRGNWEITADLFGGFQYHPTHAYVVGTGPSIRYNFVTGTRWVPFFSVGAGVTGTDIRSGDLSTEFEFNIRAGPGVRYFFRENLAATLQYQFIHLSNAGISTPNLGVNNSTIFVGLSWFH